MGNEAEKWVTDKSIHPFVQCLSLPGWLELRQANITSPLLLCIILTINSFVFISCILIVWLLNYMLKSDNVQDMSYSQISYANHALSAGTVCSVFHIMLHVLKEHSNNCTLRWKSTGNGTDLSQNPAHLSQQGPSSCGHDPPSCGLVSPFSWD